MNTDTKRINQIHESTVVDGQTGEIIQKETNISYSVSREPDYIKLYLRDVLYLKDMPQSLSRFLHSLLKRVTYASEQWGNCVVLNPAIRQAIQEECEYKSLQSVYNNTKKLVEGEILELLAKDVYRLNPYLFGRGEWKDIKKIRAEVNYSKIDGRSFEMNFEHSKTESDKRKEFANELKARAEAMASADSEGFEPPLDGQIDLDDVIDDVVNG